MTPHVKSTTAALLGVFIVASLGCGMGNVGAEDGVFSSDEALSSGGLNQKPSFVRIRTINMDRQNEWTLANDQGDVKYNAPDVFKMISELNPAVLERYTSG